METMEKRPFDGVALDAIGYTDENTFCRLGWAFCDKQWQRAWFERCIDDLTACTFQKLTDNFLLFNAIPGNVDWFDDDGWRNIVEHWRIAAWITRESGVKGILFGPEPYAKPHAQFNYSAQPEHDHYSFDEYYAKARLRGREVMQAISTRCASMHHFPIRLLPAGIAWACGCPTSQRAFGWIPATRFAWPIVTRPGGQAPTAATVSTSWAWRKSRNDRYIAFTGVANINWPDQVPGKRQRRVGVRP